MYESLACLVFYLSVTKAYKYLPDPSQIQYGTSHISFHKYTADISSIPHHVLIVYSNVYCSGSLVKSRIVVTAASCFERRTTDAPVIVKVGSTLVTGVGKVIEVLDLKIHEYFGHNINRNNDIAILMLKEHVPFGDNVKKIILVDPETAIRVGTVLDVSGWGSTNLKPIYMNVLLWSEMVVMDREDCMKVYPHLIAPSNFCVRYQSNYVSTQPLSYASKQMSTSVYDQRFWGIALSERQLSDNGGPAEYNKLLVGVLSFGAAKSVEPYVAVLTNVSYFNRWILLNSKRFMEKYCASIEYNENMSSEEDHESYAI